MNWPSIPIDRLTIFFVVLEAGGFTAAASRLKIGKNAVSQQIRKLEQELGIPLFARTTRNVIPTEDARVLYSECAPLVQKLALALENAGKEKLSGTIRISAPADYSQLVLAPILVDFTHHYPGIKLSLHTDSKVVDLVGESVDLSVRLGWPKDSTLRSVRIGEFKLHVVTSRTYLERVGKMPKHPRELSEHPWISFSVLDNQIPCAFSNASGESVDVKVQSGLGSNSAEGVLALVLAGGGLSLATDFAAAQDLERGRLIRLLPDWRLPDGGVYLTWPHSAQESPRLRACVDFLRERLSGRHNRHRPAADRGSGTSDSIQFRDGLEPFRNT